MSVHDLLSLHASARGQVIAEPDADNPTGADQVLRWEDFVTDYARVGAYMNF
jgi:hypothetical protein